MSLPAGYRDFCAAQGCSLYHPDEWSDADRQSFYGWKLKLFKAKWKAYRLDGTTRLVSYDWLRRRIREDLDALAVGPPSRPYVVCECCPKTWRQVKPEPEPTYGLDWLAQTFGRLPQ